jgi:hypothetical protein
MTIVKILAAFLILVLAWNFVLPLFAGIFVLIFRIAVFLIALYLIFQLYLYIKEN